VALDRAIYLGLDGAAKADVVRRYVAGHAGIKQVVLISPPHRRFPVDVLPCHDVEHAKVFWYRVYYDLQQRIDPSVLVVLNECMRVQDRYDLSYNCIRRYLLQTPHCLVFQYLPMIDTVEDFGVLFDFVTESRWKHERTLTRELLREASLHHTPTPVSFRFHHITTDAAVHAAYAKERAALFDMVRGDPEKDPHQIPRNLLLVTGKAKLAHVDPARSYIGRNNRFRLPNLATYRDVRDEVHRTVLELPHNFLDMTDFLAITRQSTVDVLVADTKAERWYQERFEGWARRLADAQAALHG